jgi:glycosyltransferase involved in cell wall biosynthesis
MDSKHIVVIPSWYSSGRGSGGGYFRDQALALQSAGHRVAILAPDIHTARDLRAGRVNQGARALVQQDDEVPVYRRSQLLVVPRLPYRNALAWSWGGLKLFAAYAARNGVPDLVHAHSGLNAGVLAAMIQARYGVPFVLSEHSTSFAQGRLRWWERDLIRRVIRRADRRIAVSPHLAALLERHFPGAAWSYVPNILGASFTAPRPGPTPAREAASPFVFLCAARMTAEKGHALLIEAFAEAFADDPAVRLRLAGDGPLLEPLRQLCMARGVAERVAFLRVLSSEALRTEMDASDAFALASDVETFGVVVIEAQATGLPVVVTASGGPDHLINGGNGLLVPTGDRPALRDALLTMRRTARDYDRDRIRVKAVSRYGPEAFLQRFAEIAGSLDR